MMLIIRALTHYFFIALLKIFIGLEADIEESLPKFQELVMTLKCVSRI